MPAQKPLKLAIIGSRGFPSTYGGYETFVRRLAPFLRDRGHEVCVYSRQGAPRHQVTVIDGVKCINTLGIESKSLSTLTHGFSAMTDAMFRGFDAVVVLNVANGFYLPLLKASRTPSLVNVDGLEWERAKWGSVARSVFRTGAKATAAWADRVVADSRAVGEVWEKQLGRQTTFIPYGGDLVNGHGAGMVREIGVEPGHYVLTVARLVPENNVELTLDAVELLPPSVRAVVVGAVPYESQLTRRLASAESDGRVRWLGHVDDQALLRELWGNCGAYVHGHSVGGTNPALLQALGAGAPTLALATPYNREVLGDAEQLYSDSAVELAEKLGCLLGSEADRARFRQRGQDIVCARYRWDEVCGRYAQELEALAGG
jgi:glycosyltransferase involved in cell wall biosynthesis